MSYACRQLDRHSRPSFKDVITVLLQQDPPTQPPHIPPKPQNDENVYYNTSEMMRTPAHETQDYEDVYYNTSEMMRTSAHGSLESGEMYYSTPELVDTSTDYYNTSSYSKLRFWWDS